MNEIDQLIDVDGLSRALTASPTPLLLDVRRREIFEKESHMIPGAIWCDHEEVVLFVTERLEQGRRIFVYCVHGHEISQGAQAQLSKNGFDAKFLTGGFEAWKEAGRPLASRK